MAGLTETLAEGTRVTWADAVLVLSATLTAVTVTVNGEGIGSGAL